MLTLRSRDDLMAELDDAEARLADGSAHALTPHERVVLGAVIDSMEWVLGYTAEAPLTRRLLPNPGPPELFSEWARAEKVNHDTALMREDEAAFWYGSAVEHALAWARGSDTTAPTHAGWS